MGWKQFIPAKPLNGQIILMISYLKFKNIIFESIYMSYEREMFIRIKLSNLIHLFFNSS